MIKLNPNGLWEIRTRRLTRLDCTYLWEATLYIRTKDTLPWVEAGSVINGKSKEDAVVELKRMFYFEGEEAVHSQSPTVQSLFGFSHNHHYHEMTPEEISQLANKVVENVRKRLGSEW